MAFLDQIRQAVGDGCVILTANQRLSRALRTVYDDHQIAQGLRAWKSPAILPFGSWLRALWVDAFLPITLLSAAQEEIVWQRTIAQTPEGATLLDLRGTARSAMQAWRLMHQYRLPLNAQFSAHEDWAAFRSWAMAYGKACDESNWLDDARLPDAVAVSGAELPPGLLLAGFDEFTPQQRDILAVFDRAGCPHEMLASDAEESSIVRRGCRDADQELRDAAEWARDLLTQHPKRSIGIVLLDLGVRRTRLERTFDEVLHPESMRHPVPSGTRAFHISIPDPVSDFPLVSTALLALGMASQERWALSEAGLLLRSQFLAGGVEEAPARAALDAKLRRWRRAYVPVRSIVVAAAQCPRLSGILERWQALSVPGTQLPSLWTANFRETLGAAGWPGDRVLSSAEFQVFEAWNALLRDFATLDGIAGPMSFGEALAHLKGLARDTMFQPQDPGAPIQIMGALEAAGARFDNLWICGATDQTWPAPAHPHPFLPLSLQRESRLPHSSPEREHEFAVRTFQRLRSSSPELIVSWAQNAGDVELRPSPLIENLRAENLERASLPVRPRQLTEQFIDETGPMLETTQPRGGTQLLKLQSACPFQAFADLRLGARPLDAADLGLSAMDRGSLIHDALRFFWEAVRDHATLTALSCEQLRDAAEQAVTEALRRVFRDSHDAFDTRLRALEATRLTNILVEWAEYEKTRTPFRVAFNERERLIRIAGLELAARIDRVDELPDGRQVILDYKATAPSLSAWFGDRPEEPQLPLYALSNEAPVAAVAFAQVGPEGLRFKGCAATPGVLPGTKPFSDTADAQIQDWRRVLGRIAESFRNGAAAADPKDGRATCEQCRRMSLCRIHEIAPVEQEEADAPA